MRVLRWSLNTSIWIICLTITEDLERGSCSKGHFSPIGNPYFRLYHQIGLHKWVLKIPIIVLKINKEYQKRVQTCRTVQSLTSSYNESCTAFNFPLKTICNLSRWFWINKLYFGILHIYLHKILPLFWVIYCNTEA